MSITRVGPTKGAANLTGTIDAHDVKTFYCLSGERYRSDGRLGCTTIEPLNKSLGAWEPACQV